MHKLYRMRGTDAVSIIVDENNIVHYRILLLNGKLYTTDTYKQMSDSVTINDVIGTNSLQPIYPHLI